MGSTQDENTFDYIIVGGGTAGLVVANRLSEEADARVLVIEAGSDRTTDPLVLTPGLVAGLYGKDEYDWNFCSVPQPGLNNRKINQARGKMLGGSSALNFMMILYPNRGILDAWASLGNSGWDFDGLAPYFHKFATLQAPSQSTRDVAAMTHHNDELVGDGPLQLSFGDGLGPVNSAWMETFAKLGLQVRDDLRGGKVLGAFQNATSIDPATKTRAYSASAYLTPEVTKRPNLIVLTDTLVKKIVFDTAGAEPVATGVLVQTKDGAEKTISAKTEVVLAAGALQTPQLLELSGVGGAELLGRHGIPVVIDNANVGENLQDHPIVCQSFEVNPGVPSSDVLRDPAVLSTLLGQYVANKEGPLGQLSISVAYAPLADLEGPLAAEAKKALFAAHPGAVADEGARLVQALVESEHEPTAEYLLFPSQITINESPASMAEYIVPARPENFVTVMTILNHPFSRGTVHIGSGSASDAPVWDPRYNSNPLDLELLARNVQFVERIVATEPFASVFKPGGARLPDLRGDELERAKEIVRQRQISVFHIAGSCAMLPREKGGVVDDRLRVHGTKGLRIVDASVFPLEPLGNIQSTVYAVAEKAADLIKEDRRAAK